MLLIDTMSLQFILNKMTFQIHPASMLTKTRDEPVSQNRYECLKRSKNIYKKKQYTGNRAPRMEETIMIKSNLGCSGSLFELSVTKNLDLSGGGGGGVKKKKKKQPFCSTK